MKQNVSIHRMGATMITMTLAIGCGGNDNSVATLGNTTGGADSEDIGAGTDTASMGEDDDDSATSPTDGAFADVTAVSVTGDASAYTFSVTVASTDIDCTEFADWWEVVTPSGELIYRRILAHSHTDANGTGNPFTREGGPAAIAKDAQVIVRAHMNTVGYRGRAMRGSVTEGFEAAADLPDDFGVALADAEPQPTGCAF